MEYVYYENEAMRAPAGVARTDEARRSVEAGICDEFGCSAEWGGEARREGGQKGSRGSDPRLPGLTVDALCLTAHLGSDPVHQ